MRIAVRPLRWSCVLFSLIACGAGCFAEPFDEGAARGALTSADCEPPSNSSKVNVCHRTGGGDNVLIQVSGNAASRHLDPATGHSGDVAPGAGGLNCVCEPLTSENICVGAVVGTECSDDDACTDGDGCDGAGGCASGAPLSCDTAAGRADGSLTECQVFTGTCDSASGCEISDLADGTACSDGDPATCESCLSGVCEPESCGAPPNLFPGWDVCTDGGSGHVSYTVLGNGGTADNFEVTVSVEGSLPFTSYDIYLNDYGVMASSWDGIPEVTINPATRVDCDSGVTGTGGTAPHPAYILHTFTTDAQGDASFTQAYTVPSGRYELQTALTRAGELPARFKTGDTFGSTETVIVPGNLSPGWDVCTDGGSGHVTYEVTGPGGAPSNLDITVSVVGSLAFTSYDIWLNDYGVMASTWDGVPETTINPAFRVDCSSGVSGTGGTAPHPAYIIATVTTDALGDATFTQSYTVPAGTYELQTALTRAGELPARFNTGDTFGSTETVVVAEGPNLRPGWDLCTDPGGGDVTYSVVGAGGTANNLVLSITLDGVAASTSYDVYLNDYGVLLSSWDGIPSITINPATRVDCDSGVTGTGGSAPHPAYRLVTITTDTAGDASFTQAYTVPSGVYELQTVLTRAGAGAASFKTGDTFGSTESVVVP